MLSLKALWNEKKRKKKKRKCILIYLKHGEEKNVFVLFYFKIQDSLFWDLDWKNHAAVEEYRIQSKEDQEEIEASWEHEWTWIHKRNIFMLKWSNSLKNSINNSKVTTSWQILWNIR